MKALIQRVKSASVKVDNKTIGNINQGLLIFLGIQNNDGQNELKYLAEKCLNMRIFSDQDGKFNHSLLEIKGEVLVVSQFTLYADTKRGRRPSFVQAAKPEISQPLYKQFVTLLKKSDIKVETGEFGAMMDVELINDGPVTIMVEKKAGA